MNVAAANASAAWPLTAPPRSAEPRPTLRLGDHRHDPDDHQADEDGVGGQCQGRPVHAVAAGQDALVERQVADDHGRERHHQHGAGGGVLGNLGEGCWVSVIRSTTASIAVLSSSNASTIATVTTMPIT